MKKSLPILLGVLFGVSLLQAQVILNPRFFGGYIVTPQNDTLRGTIKLPKSASKGDFSFTDILWKVRFVDKNGVENKYYPSQLKAFSFWLENGREVNFVSRPNTVKAFGGFGAERDHLFLEMAINGHLKLLRGYFFTSTPNGQEANIVNYLQKGQNPLFRYRYVLFRMDLASYLSDNTTIVEKIHKRTYHPRDIEKIVKEYNQDYEAKQQQAISTPIVPQNIPKNYVPKRNKRSLRRNKQ